METNTGASEGEGNQKGKKQKLGGQRRWDWRVRVVTDLPNVLGKE